MGIHPSVLGNSQSRRPRVDRPGRPWILLVHNQPTAAPRAPGSCTCGGGGRGHRGSPRMHVHLCQRLGLIALGWGGLSCPSVDSICIDHRPPPPCSTSRSGLLHLCTRNWYLGTFWPRQLHPQNLVPHAPQQWIPQRGCFILISRELFWGF